MCYCTLYYLLYLAPLTTADIESLIFGNELHNEVLPLFLVFLFTAKHNLTFSDWVLRLYFTEEC